MFEIKNVLFMKKGNRWNKVNTEVNTFNSYNKAKAYYNNVVNDNFGKSRMEYGSSRFGGVSAKTFYSPNGDLKHKYIF